MSQQLSCPNCNECLGPNGQEIPFYANCSNCEESFENPEGYYTAKCEHCDEIFNIDNNFGNEYAPMCSLECVELAAAQKSGHSGDHGWRNGE